MYPLLFDIGPFSISSLWFFASLGFLAGSLMFAQYAKRDRLDLEIILRHGWFLLIATLVGARLIFFLENIHIFAYQGISLSILLDFFTLWDKGFSFWGGLSGFFASLYLILKKNKESFPAWLDIIIPSVLTGMLFGSIGMFLDGSGHGHTTHLPWSVIFESPSVKYAVPVHPTQIYATIMTASILIFLMYLLRTPKVKRQGGFIGHVGIFLASSARFLEEFFRGDDTIFIFFLRFPQLLAFFSLLFFGYLLVQKSAPKRLFFRTKQLLSSMKKTTE